MGAILVAFATKHGATEDVAREIAAALRERGYGVTLRAAADVTELLGHDAVVLGGPLYYGHWHRDASRFLKRHRAALERLPVAAFALGPRGTAHDDPAGWEKARDQLEGSLRRQPWLAPVDSQLFGGALDPTRLHFPFNRMPGGDWRDWDAIRRWAAALPGAFGLEPPTGPPAPVDPVTAVRA
jgi:menaquinone-dependent protoporphyrinogen oxidase